MKRAPNWWKKKRKGKKFNVQKERSETKTIAQHSTARVAKFNSLNILNACNWKDTENYREKQTRGKISYKFILIRCCCCFCFHFVIFVWIFFFHALYLFFLQFVVCTERLNAKENKYCVENAFFFLFHNIKLKYTADSL